MRRWIAFAAIALVAGGLASGAAPGVAHAAPRGFVFSDEFRFTATLISRSAPGAFSLQTNNCRATSDNAPAGPEPVEPCFAIANLTALPGGGAVGTASLEQSFDGITTFHFTVGAAPGALRPVTGTGIEIDPVEGVPGPRPEINFAAIGGTLQVMPQASGGPVVTADLIVSEPPTAP
ncbi:MAG TPA: hypothetical protein VHT75_09095 [Acidimicrobiales bacterium]|jgi:hypothetical protein|nr:hypothetical protein [Acidimicrobiales bacterium]